MLNIRKADVVMVHSEDHPWDSVIGVVHETNTSDSWIEVRMPTEDNGVESAFVTVLNSDLEKIGRCSRM